NVTEIALKWESSDPSVATVNQYGTVTFLKPGNTTITVETLNGLTSNCDVVVNNLLKGDVNKDGKVALYDAFRILRYVILGGDNLTEEQRYIMDYNDDGKVALYDAFRFLRQVILS